MFPVRFLLCHNFTLQLFKNSFDFFVISPPGLTVDLLGRLKDHIYVLFRATGGAVVDCSITSRDVTVSDLHRFDVYSYDRINIEVIITHPLCEHVVWKFKSGVSIKTSLMG